MSNMKEKLSAFIDGELSDQEAGEVMRALQQDESLRRIWTRYCMARDALGGNTAAGLADDFASRVSATIASEPTVLAPASDPKRTGGLGRASRIVGQLAIAASVAAIAIIGLRNIVPEQTNGTGASIAQAPATGRFVQAGATRWDQSKADAENELNMYLAEHNRHSSAATRKGMMTYIHVVGYDAEK